MDNFSRWSVIRDKYHISSEALIIHQENSRVVFGEWAEVGNDRRGMLWGDEWAAMLGERQS